MAKKKEKPSRAGEGDRVPLVGSPGTGGSSAQTHNYRAGEPSGKPPAAAAAGEVTMTTPVGTMTRSTGTDTPPPAEPAGSASPAAMPAPNGKVKLATIWLEGCSGCHMSFLDMDERLIALAERVDVVYSPLVDNKHCPPDVDVTLVEGAIATDEDVSKMRRIRQKTKVLISLGDCAVTGNVPSMRNSIRIEDVYDRAYSENAATQKQRPTHRLPVLLERVRPVHEVVKVDVHIPGCPPPADAIYYIITELLDGRTPDISSVTRFGR